MVPKKDYPPRPLKGFYEPVLDWYYDTQIFQPKNALKAFGEFSVKLIKNDGVSRFVMLSSHSHETGPDGTNAIDDDVMRVVLSDIDSGQFTLAKDYGWKGNKIYARTTPMNQPWNWSPAIDTGRAGYGPYIMDKFTETFDSNGQKHLRLWHVVSTWQGPITTAYYGVYTTHSDIPWGAN